ncbi:GGDEF domain-containing protein [Ectothiorhodospiraceae bacterium WFHF3C12]|nr:GGDEF domain-containing protein [Ectothiorhodospiraceae bacterium WFHF3C12]
MVENRGSMVAQEMRAALLKRLCILVILVTLPFFVLHMAVEDARLASLSGAIIGVTGIVLGISLRWGATQVLTWTLTLLLVALSAVAARLAPMVIQPWLYPLCVSFFFILPAPGATVAGVLLFLACFPSFFGVMAPIELTRAMVTGLMTVALSASLADLFTRRGHLLFRLATEDALTGAGNRRGLFLELDRIGGEKRRDNGTAILLIDADHFKRVNDLHGHSTGDRALKALSSRIKASCRKSDRLYRYGGEEFVLIAHGVDREGAVRLGEKIRANVAGEPLVDGLRLTVSIGIAALTADTEPTTSMSHADNALYDAKASGRNRVETASPTS